MKKVLVAEDNDSNFILMTYILKKYYQFDRAKNGQEAVEMVDKGGFAGSVSAHDCQTASHLEFYRNILQHPCLGARIPEGNMLKLPVSSEACISTIKKLIGE